MAPTPCGEDLWRWGTWPSEPGRSPSGDARITFLQFNFCGSNCNSGNTGRPVEALRDAVVRRSPDVVILNEICLAQADRLWGLLHEDGVALAACFGATTGFSKCPGLEGERWFGNAVFTRGAGIGAPRIIPLPNNEQAREKRSATSMGTDLHGQVAVVSSAHLVPRDGDDGLNQAQIEELARAHNGLAAMGQPVILGGDLNAPPGRVSAFYPPEGAFQEVDFETNSPTYGRRKIDFIFLSAGRFAGLSCRTRRTVHSDHKLLWGEATLLA